MKRIIHALAVLWSLVSRTGPSRCESANPQIRVFANSPISASARKNNLISCFLAHISVKFGNKRSFSDIYPLTKGNLRQARNLSYALRSRNSYVKALTILFMCLIAALNAPAQSGAAANTDSIQPLQIGDKIPDKLWNSSMNLWTVNARIEEISLLDFKGKWVLLDFWNTYCGACINAFPRMNALQEEYGSSLVILNVTNETAGRLDHVMKRRPWMTGLLTQSLVSDTLLHAVFPHQTVPHLVLINHQGVVVAFPKSKDFTAEYVEQWISVVGKPERRKEVYHAMVY